MEGLATNWNFTKLATNAPINQTPEQEVYKLEIINPNMTTKTQKCSL